MSDLHTLADVPSINAKTWPTRLALAWALIFGALYARMVVIERLPSLAWWLGW